MKYLEQNDPRFHRLGLKVGSFLAVIVLLVILMAGILGWRQDLFEPAAYFEISPDNAAYINPGMDVSFRGIRVGRVHRVALDDSGIPRVQLRLQRRAAAWLHADASAMLTGQGPLETPYIALEAGSPDHPSLAEGSTITFRREASLGELAAAVEEQFRPLIAAGGKLVGDLSRPDGDLQITLAGLRSVTGTVQQDLPPALADIRQTAQTTREYVADASAEESDLGQLRANLLSISQQLDKRLPAMLDETEQTVSSLRKATARIDKSIQVSAPQVEDLVKKSNETAAKADVLIKDLRKAWLMKLLLPKSGTPRE